MTLDLESSLPHSEIGLFQSELEVLRTPAYDLAPFLRGDSGHFRDGERCSVHVLHERTIRSTGQASAGLDALVVGFNALQQSPVSTREAFSRSWPSGNTLILHQLDAACFEFMAGPFGLSLRDIPGRVYTLRPPVERNADEEPLLHWPRSLARDQEQIALDGLAIRGFVPEAQSDWRVVLEVFVEGERVPVLMRTARVRPERIVVCSALLEWRDPTHANLLENLLTYCSLGSPDVAVVAPEDRLDLGYRPELFAERLRLRGAKAFVAPVRSATALDLDRWPFRAVKHIVVPDEVTIDSVVQDEAGQRWAEGGGTLTRVGLHGELTLHNRATDARWLAERWAAWYAGTDPAVWQQKLGSCRAVLRVLAELGGGATARALELESAREYPAAAIATYLETRVRKGTCEETISATCAALDIDRLLEGRGISSSTRGEVEKWLRNAFAKAPGHAGRDDPTPPIEDQLDIVRALGDAELLGRALERLAGEPVTALAFTRMCEALVACQAWTRFPEIPPNVDAALTAQLIAELDRHPLISGELVSAVAELSSRMPEHPAASLDGAAFQSAAGTVMRHSSIAALGTVNEAETSAIEISTEALALLRHARQRPSNTWQIHPSSEGLPAPTVQEVLHEARRSREVVHREAKERIALAKATWLLGAAAIATLTIAIVWAFDWADVESPYWETLGGAFLLALAGLWGISVVRGKRGDPAPALAGDILGATCVAIAACLAFLTLRGSPTDVEALDTVLALLVLGVITSGLLLVLRLADLSPLWAHQLRQALNERGVPFLSGEKETSSQP